MLEVLLFQYKDMFGEDFPLDDFAGKPEIDVINIIYDCVSNNLTYDPDRKGEYKAMDAPGMQK